MTVHIARRAGSLPPTTTAPQVVAPGFERGLQGPLEVVETRDRARAQAAATRPPEEYVGFGIEYPVPRRVMEALTQDERDAMTLELGDLYFEIQKIVERWTLPRFEALYREAGPDALSMPTED